MNQENVMQNIIRLRGAIEFFVFKQFLKEYSLPKGLSQSHAITMMILRHHKSLPMSHLSQALGVEKGSFTSIADKLIKQGYVISERSEQDRRKYLLSLTEKGYAFTDDFGSNHKEYVEGKVKELPAEKEEEFLTSLTSILSVFEDLIEKDECCDK